MNRMDVKDGKKSFCSLQNMHSSRCFNNLRVQIRKYVAPRERWQKYIKKKKKKEKGTEILRSRANHTGVELLIQQIS